MTKRFVQQVVQLVVPLPAVPPNQIRDDEHCRWDSLSLERGEAVFRHVTVAIVEGDRGDRFIKGFAAERVLADLVETHEAESLTEPFEVTLEHGKADEHAWDLPPRLGREV